MRDLRLPPPLSWDLFPYFRTAWPLIMELISCPETSVDNYRHTLHNLPEEWSLPKTPVVSQYLLLCSTSYEIFCCYSLICLCQMKASPDPSKSFIFLRSDFQFNIHVLSIITFFCVISLFLSCLNEICALLGFYIA